MLEQNDGGNAGYEIMWVELLLQQQVFGSKLKTPSYHNLELGRRRCWRWGMGVAGEVLNHGRGSWGRGRRKLQSMILLVLKSRISLKLPFPSSSLPACHLATFSKSHMFLSCPGSLSLFHTPDQFWTNNLPHSKQVRPEPLSPAYNTSFFGGGGGLSSKMTEASASSPNTCQSLWHLRLHPFTHSPDHAPPLCRKLFF